MSAPKRVVPESVVLMAQREVYKIRAAYDKAIAGAADATVALHEAITHKLHTLHQLHEVAQFLTNECDDDPHTDYFAEAGIPTPNRCHHNADHTAFDSKFCCDVCGVKYDEQVVSNIKKARNRK